MQRIETEKSFPLLNGMSEIEAVQSIMVSVPRDLYDKSLITTPNGDEWAKATRIRGGIWRELGITDAPYPNIKVQPADVEQIGIALTGTLSDERKSQVEQSLGAWAAKNFVSTNS